jgi:tetratricopeptide (TPR) repeat protein
VRLKRFWTIGMTLTMVLTLGVATASRQGDENAPTRAVRQNSLGIAYLSQQRVEEALELFEQAQTMDPSLTAARLNQAIALYNLQRFEDARDILLELTATAEADAWAWYNLGLTYRYVGDPEQAIEAFDRVLDLNPDDADTHYVQGLMYVQLERFPDAIAAYQRAVDQVPYHASAEFGLARAYQRQGEGDLARQHLERFQLLTRENIGVPMGLAYGDQGRYSMAQEVGPMFEAPAETVTVQFASVASDAGLDFTHTSDPTEEGAGVTALLGPGACFIDYDNDSAMDLFLPNGAAGASSALYRNLGEGRFENTTEAAGVDLQGLGLGCVAGDYDNDGYTDLAAAVGGRVVLFRNTGDNRFEDRTRESELSVEGMPAGISFLDYDHDGDLDLYVTRFSNFPLPAEGKAFEFTIDSPVPSNMLWRNDGDGTFTEQTTESGLSGTAPGVGAVATDINNDRAIDLIVTGWQDNPTLFVNPREGAFEKRAAWPDLTSPTAGVTVADFNKDGWMDVAFGHWASPGLSVWRNVDGTTFERVALPELGWDRGWGLAVVDYDNDGWLDLAATGEGPNGAEARLLRNLGSDRFEDVTTRVGLDRLELERPRALISADYDEDGDADLLVTENGGGVHLLRNDGGNRNAWVRLDLEGLNDSKSAIGTKVEIFAGTHRQKWEVQSSSGYLGQSATSVIAGLGENNEVDTVRLLWPTGVLQDETQPATRQAHVVTEIDRRGSSCPVLFAWNGERYEFITDAIGAGIAGHWVAPGQRNVSDPTEYIRVDGDNVRARDGRLSFRLSEPMEELVYLDQVRLLAVDHPADVDVYPNEYFASGPPFPSFEVIASRDAHVPAGAWDENGRDVLPDLLELDRRYVTGFNSLPFHGLARTHSLQLDLGSVDVAKPVRLLMHGFVDYFTPTALFAALQSGIEPITPYLDALDASGRWVRVLDDMGFPAGLARTMTRDLSGLLPEGTRRIRITTNLEIYWDRILIDTTDNQVPVTLAEIPLSEATLAWRGYPRLETGNPASDIIFVYDDLSPTGPFAKHRGAYTAFGNVRPLLEEAEDHFVIFGSGEELALEFDPSRLPPPDPGWKRDYFFYADGFEKDMDSYEAFSQTVGPHPRHSDSPYPYASKTTTEANVNYQLEWNTRLVSGRGVPAFRFAHKHPDQ